MQTSEVNSDALDHALNSMRESASSTTADELSSLVRQIKEHEAIAFHQMREIGGKLNRAAELIPMNSRALDKWARNDLSYTPVRSYRLRRFAHRMFKHPDERLVGMFERSGRNSLWFLLDAPDAVIYEVEQLVTKQRALATREQVERIRAKYSAGKKAAQTQLDTVNLLIENSLDQDVEVRKLETTIETLNEQLASEQHKVRALKAQAKLR